LISPVDVWPKTTVADAMRSNNAAVILVETMNICLLATMVMSAALNCDEFSRTVSPFSSFVSILSQQSLRPDALRYR
jgi:hypothetical protein